jgi:GTPase SAR1 family protein
MKGRSSVAFSLFAKANFKILMVGAKDAGKTSLIVRYIKKMFSNSKNVALGIEFYSSTV